MEGVAAAHRLAVAAGVLILLAAGFAAPAAPAREPPKLAAASAVVVDARDGHVIYARSPRSQRAIASATKLMTALVTLEELRPGRLLTAPRYIAGPLESRIDLRAGERMSVSDLLRALLLESANDAAATLARGASGSLTAFVRRMNERARALGLAKTRFANPIGLDDEDNHSSALDLSRLARRLLRNDTFATIVDSPSARLLTGGRPRMVRNRNRLVERVPWIEGVKTGHTLRAGYVLVGAGTRKGVQLVSVVLGEPSETRRDADTLALLDYGFSRYSRFDVLRRGRTLARADVEFFDDREARLTVARDVPLTVRKGEPYRTRIEVPDEVEGPLSKGARVGRAQVFRNGVRVRTVPLVTAESVPEAGTLRRSLQRPFWPALLALAAVAGALLARRRRAARVPAAEPRKK